MLKKISWHGSALRVTSLSDDYPDVNGVFSSQRGAIITELWGPSQAKSNLSYIHNYMNIAYAWEAETLLGLYCYLTRTQWYVTISMKGCHLLVRKSNKMECHEPIDQFHKSKMHYPTPHNAPYRTRGAHQSWRHQMETFSALLAIWAGSSPVPGEFPAQRPVTRSFDVFFDLRLNKHLSKQSWAWWFETSQCPWWRHNNALPQSGALQDSYCGVGLHKLLINIRVVCDLRHRDPDVMVDVGYS